MKKDRKNLRWGYSTGACAAAAAKAAWIRLTRGGAPQSIWVHFLDGRERELPLLQSGAGHMAAIRKNGGDDPDCTHGATLTSAPVCPEKSGLRTMSSRSGTAR